MATLLRGQEFGGGGGSSFSEDPQTSKGSRVTKVIVRDGSLIDAIQFVYEDGTGTKHGGNGGKERVFVLEKDELIIGAQLHTGSMVDSLDLFTNRGRNFHAGGTGGGARQIQQPSGTWEVAGVYGRSGSKIDSLGFVWRLLGDSPVKLQESASAGGNGGSSFAADQQASDTLQDVKALRLWTGSEVDAIQFVYSSGDGAKRGGGGGSMKELILQAGESLVGCSGRSGSRIDRLRFWTNKGRALEGGGGGGSSFDLAAPSPVPEGSEAWTIAGCSGRNGSRLDQIRVLWRARPDIEDITYDGFVFDWAKKSMVGTPQAQVWEVTLGPNDTDVEQSLTSTQDYWLQNTDTYTDSWSQSNSTTLSMSTSVTVSSELTLEKIFKLGGSVTTTLGTSTTHTDTTGGSASNSTTTTYKVSVAFKVTVPPHSTVIGKAKNVIERYTVPYTAKVRVTYRSGKVDVAETNGILNGQQNSIEASYEQL